MAQKKSAERTIINWHYLDDEALKQKERQAIKEGGRILTLESAAGDTHDDLSASKDSTSEADAQEGGGKSAVAVKEKPKKDDDDDGPAGGGTATGGKGGGGYSISPTTYTNKKGKTTDMSLLKFDNELTPEQERAVKEFAKERDW